MRHALPLIALVLIACGKQPEAGDTTQVTANEKQVAAKAVADVEAAMADAREAPSAEAR